MRRGPSVKNSLSYSVSGRNVAADRGSRFLTHNNHEPLMRKLPPSPKERDKGGHPAGGHSRMQRLHWVSRARPDPELPTRSGLRDGVSASAFLASNSTVQNSDPLVWRSSGR
jgi:hypothetical protein